MLGADTPVGNCHGIVVTKECHIVLLTDQTENNFIVYDQAGKLLHKWGTTYPGAHGLSLVEEKGKEVLYFTDTKLGKVFKASLDGELLGEWGWPEASGKYAKAEEYKPSWTLHRPDGGFYVLDGYGKDYIPHYDAEGKLKETLGGAEGGIVHWGPHGGMWDGGADGSLLIAMSDQQHLQRLSHRRASHSLFFRCPEETHARSEKRATTITLPTLPTTGQRTATAAASSPSWTRISSSSQTSPALPPSMMTKERSIT